MDYNNNYKNKIKQYLYYLKLINPYTKSMNKSNKINEE